jgi:hypothetical protein
MEGAARNALGAPRRLTVPRRRRYGEPAALAAALPANRHEGGAMENDSYKVVWPSGKVLFDDLPERKVVLDLANNIDIVISGVGA